MSTAAAVGEYGLGAVDGGHGFLVTTTVDIRCLTHAGKNR